MLIIGIVHNFLSQFFLTIFMQKIHLTKTQLYVAIVAFGLGFTLIAIDYYYRHYALLVSWGMVFFLISILAVLPRFRRNAASVLTGILVGAIGFEISSQYLYQMITPSNPGLILLLGVLGSFLIKVSISDINWADMHQDRLLDEKETVKK